LGFATGFGWVFQQGPSNNSVLNVIAWVRSQGVSAYSRRACTDFYLRTFVLIKTWWDWWGWCVPHTYVYLSVAWSVGWYDL